MQYEIKAVRDATEVVSLLLHATDETDARRQARAAGYTVLTAVQRGPFKWVAPRTLRRGFPLFLLTQQLLVLLEAGVTLTEALDSLAEKERTPAVASVIRRVAADVREGLSLSAALDKQPAVFPPLYVATVRASEKTGDLGPALTRYVEYQERMDAVRTTVINASVYPLLLLVAGGLVSLFLLFYVVPRFSRIYEEVGANLSFAASLLMRWGQLVESNAGTVVIAGTVICVGLAYAVRSNTFRAWLAERVWRLPVAGQQIRIYQLARFYRSVGMLLRSGIAIVPALDMAAELLHPRLREPLVRAARSVRDGHALSAALEQHGLTTPIATRMLLVGERSGTMGDMLERVAVFHEAEIAAWVHWITRLFEPILMALIGIAIGLIVILMYLPVFELAGSLQ